MLAVGGCFCHRPIVTLGGGGIGGGGGGGGGQCGQWLDAAAQRHVGHRRPPGNQLKRTQQLQPRMLAQTNLSWPALLVALPLSPNLANVPQPAKHDELLHLRSRCSIKSEPRFSRFSRFFCCSARPTVPVLEPVAPLPLCSSLLPLHFLFSALLFLISSKVSRLMF